MKTYSVTFYPAVNPANGYRYTMIIINDYVSGAVWEIPRNNNDALPLVTKLMVHLTARADDELIEDIVADVLYDDDWDD